MRVAWTQRWMVVAGLCLLLGSAHAQAPAAVTATPAAAKEEAAARFDRGVRFYDEGDYKAALAEFDAAYRAVPAWVLLYNIGLAERRLFRYDEAVHAFERYLHEGGAEVPPERREKVAEELRAIRAQVAEVTVRVDGAAAAIDVDGAEVGRTPLAGALLLAPGRHAIRARRDGEDAAERTVDVVSGQRLDVALAPSPRVTTATLAVQSRPLGAELTIDGHYAGKAPWSGTLDPGGHEVRATLAGYEKARSELVLTAGQARELVVELTLLPPAAAKPKWYKRWYVWTPVALVVAGGAVGGVFGYMATHPGPDLVIDFPPP